MATPSSCKDQCCSHLAFRSSVLVPVPSAVVAAIDSAGRPDLDHRCARTGSVTDGVNALLEIVGLNYVFVGTGCQRVIDVQVDELGDEFH